MDQCENQIIGILLLICKYGVPDILVTDQGREFVNAVLEGLADLLQYKQMKITPYHPHENGVIERANGTLIDQYIADVGKRKYCQLGYHVPCGYLYI